MTNLTPAQVAALRAGIQAETNPGVVAARAAGTDNVITTWCNGKSTTPAWVASMQPADIDEAMLKASGKLDSLTAGKQFSLGRLMSFARDFRRNAIRSWVIDIWGAVGSAGTSDSFKILSACLGMATRGEVYIGGTVKNEGGAPNQVSGLDRSFVGDLSDDDIIAARGSGW